MSADNSIDAPAKQPKRSIVAYAAICDLNGIWRGKRLPSRKVASIAKGGLKMPLSLGCVDVWGDDVLTNPIFTDNGDGDCEVSSINRNPLIVEGANGAKSALYPLWFTENGGPHPSDPRAALAAIRDQFIKRGMTAVVGTELEFYLIDPDATKPRSGVETSSGRRLTSTNVMTLGDLQAVQPFLDDIHNRCSDYGIGLDSSVAEAGPGQYEVVLGHRSDAVAAADDFVLLKYLIRMTAQKHGMEACFMAKPYPDAAGCGFHAHLSLLDADGNNLFAAGEALENPLLRHAVAGLLAALPQSMLIFAPHLNSYKRYVAEALAPSIATWGEEDRTAAVRIPLATGMARRIEHRVSGADANPYLVLAAILGAALHGIDRKMEPPEPINASNGEPQGENLPTKWETALECFETAEPIGPLFGPELNRSIVEAKRQEQRVFAQHMSGFELNTYRDVV